MSETRVVGAVTAWGRIETHKTGFRAQYAEPVVLAYDEAQPYKHVRDLKAIASEMGLACVPVDQLEEEAAKHGQVMPEELRPERDELWTPGANLPGFASGGYISGGSGYVTLPSASHRRDRGGLLAVGLNAAALALNLVLGVTFGSWPNYGAATVNALILAWLLHPRRRR